VETLLKYNCVILGIQKQYRNNSFWNHTQRGKFTMKRLLSSAQKDELNAKLRALDKSQAVIEFKMDGTIVQANENFLNTVGYALNEVQGRHHSIFVEPNYKTSREYQDFWNTLNNGVYQAAEYKRLGKGGKEIWIQASYNPIVGSDGKPYKVVKYATDITKQKLQNADFQGQIDAIGKSQAVIEFNMDGTIINANENFLSTVGYSLAEIKGRHHSMFVEPAYGTSQEYKNFWEKLGRGEYQAAEYKRFGKGGKEVWIQASYNPIFDTSGKPFKVVKYASNITPQIKARDKNEQIRDIVIENMARLSQTTGRSAELATTAVAAAEQTSANTQSVASGAEQLSASVREISGNMTLSKESVDQAVLQTAAADKAVQALAKNADDMLGIVELIQGIASQINLLALNATIESARAGEAGKGFAVVANEVKNLAGQTAKATDDVSKMISTMRGVSAETVACLAGIKAAIETTGKSFASVMSAVEEQSAVTRNMSADMQTASAAVSTITGNLRDIAGAISESDEVVKTVRTAIESLG